MYQHQTYSTAENLTPEQSERANRMLQKSLQQVPALRKPKRLTNSQKRQMKRRQAEQTKQFRAMMQNQQLRKTLRPHLMSQAIQKINQQPKNLAATTATS
jgi:hypothetical protein